MNYKPKSWWHEQRDAKWASLHREGMTFMDIAMLYHYHPETVAKRVRAWEAWNVRPC